MHELFSGVTSSPARVPGKKGGGFYFLYLLVKARKA